MAEQHPKEEILSLLQEAEVTTVATAAGEDVRCRMMHFAASEDFNVYLASMKGDPKTLQITHHPSISLLVHRGEGDINDSREVEITGKAFLVHDEAERQKAFVATARKSPVVKYFLDTGNTAMLDCIKVAPQTVKFRVFREIVQGMPPTVIDFPQNRGVVSDWGRLWAKIKNWKLAIRVSFLTASIVPILLGTAIAFVEKGVLYWEFFLLTLIAGLFMQASANVVNDYADHKSGNDDSNREFVRPFSGGSRAIQLGLLTPLETLVGALLFAFIASGLGLYLAWARGPLLLILGALGLLSSLFYVGGPFNWSGRGVGEAVVGLNFGLLMTLGAYYVQAQTFSWTPLIASLPVAILIAAVLYINEFPDYHADKLVGKATLVVRLGREKAAALYAGMMIAVYLSLLAGVVLNILPPIALIGLLTLPLSIRAVQYAQKHHSNSFDLAPANALTIVSHLGTGLLLTLAYAWEGAGPQGIGYVALLGILFALFVAYMYRQVERQKTVFLGLKQIMR